MPFTPKSWKNLPDTTTPLSAEELVDLETRLSAYTDAGTKTEKERAEAAEALKEAVANKDTTTSLGTSDTKYPSQKAVKTYVDAEKTRAETAEATKPTATLDTDGTLATNSDTRVPSQKAVKTYSDAIKSLLQVYNVKDSTYGAKGDGSTDDSTAIQSAINAASAAGGAVFFPPGTYIVGTTITLKSKVHIYGAGVEVSIIKLKNSANTDVFKTANYAAAGIAHFSVRTLTIDGNKANNTSGSGLLLDGQRFAIENVDIHHCAADGLNAQMTAETVLDTEGGDEAFVRGVRIWLSGSRNVRWDIRDGHLVDVIAICKDSESKLTNILIDTNGFSTKCMNCHAWGQSKYAWQVKGTIETVNCNAEGGVTADVIWETDNNVWIGGQVFRDGSNHGLIGFLWANEKGYNTTIAGTLVMNCDEPFKFTGDGGGSIVRAKVVGLSSGKKAVNGSPSESVVFEFGDVQGGGTIGKGEFRRKRAPTAETTLESSIVDGDTNDRFSRRADGLLLFGPGNAGQDVWIQRPEKEVIKVSHRLQVGVKSEEVASAGTITIKDGINLVKISGTTEIKKVNATTDGHRVTLKFASTVKVVDGENLKLVSNFEATADDTLTLICDGTNWYEAGRSAN